MRGKSKFHRSFDERLSISISGTTESMFEQCRAHIQHTYTHTQYSSPKKNSLCYASTSSQVCSCHYLVSCQTLEEERDERVVQVDHHRHCYHHYRGCCHAGVDTRCHYFFLRRWTCCQLRNALVFAKTYGRWVGGRGKLWQCLSICQHSPIWKQGEPSCSTFKSWVGEEPWMRNVERYSGCCACSVVVIEITVRETKENGIME